MNLLIKGSYLYDSLCAVTAAYSFCFLIEVLIEVSSFSMYHEAMFEPVNKGVSLV